MGDEKKPKAVSTRHSWGEPLRSEHKTERECARCGMVKATHHQMEPFQPEGSQAVFLRDVYWTEFWLGLDKVAGPDDPTPPCPGQRPADGPQSAPAPEVSHVASH